MILGVSNATNNISIYAACLSTIVAVWNIFKEIKSKKGRLKFHYDEEWIDDPDNQVMGNYALISIVNLSEKSRVIRKIQIERYLSKKEIIIVNDTDTSLPIKLDNGEQSKHRLFSLDDENTYQSYDYRELKDDSIPDEEKMLSTLIYTPTKIRIRVFDTTGKSYKSKWIKVKKINSIPDFINT